jgi:hypothetical protein
VSTELVLTSKIFQSCCEKSWMALDLIKDNFSMLEEGSSERSKEGNDSERMLCNSKKSIIWVGGWATYIRRCR